jgi:hypothetical protein
MHHFAAWLLHLTKGKRRPDRVDTSLLAELASGRREKVLAWSDLAFGDGPGAQILAGPERTPEVDEQDLDSRRPTPKEQEPGGCLGH